MEAAQGGAGRTQELRSMKAPPLEKQRIQTRDKLAHPTSADSSESREKEQRKAAEKTAVKGPSTDWQTLPHANTAAPTRSRSKVTEAMKTKSWRYSR